MQGYVNLKGYGEFAAREPPLEANSSDEGIKVVVPLIASGLGVLLLSKSIVLRGTRSRWCIFRKPTCQLRDVIPDVSLSGA